jgi:hypothetical protein
MEPNIIRYYPHKKPLITFPFRYPSEYFDKCDVMKKDINLMNDYDKWKNGINYKTNRKIKIGKKTHNLLSSKFIIRCHIFIDDVINKNKNDYLNETYEIYEKINKINDELNKYNENVESAIILINSLGDWNDFILFEGHKFGINYIYNNIHMENNCLGNVMQECKKCSCSSCENWNGCGSSEIWYYKCDKCDFIRVK